MVTKTIGGIAFDDPWAWLQDETPEARAWQDERTAEATAAARTSGWYERVYRSNLVHDALNTELMMPPRRAGGRWFRLGESDGQPAMLVDDQPMVRADELVDPDDPRPVQLWFFEPSPDGRWCAVAYAPGGDTDGHWIVIDAASGRPTAARIPSLLFNSPRPGWLPGDGGFFLADRTGNGGHRLTVFTPDGAATTTVELPLPDTVPAVLPQVSPGGQWAVALSAPHELRVRAVRDRRTGEWRAFLPDDFEGECYGDWLNDDDYLAIVTEGAPRGRLVAIPAATSSDRSTWRELLVEGDAVLRTVFVTATNVVVVQLEDVALGIRTLDLAGSPVGSVDVPPYSSTLRSLLRIPQRTEVVVIDCGSFLQPPALYRVDPDHLVPLDGAARALDGIDVDQRFAESPDGTSIPYFVVKRQGVDGCRPTLLYAYGGYNAPITPNYLAHVLPFVEAGGVYVAANIRGGGEYGATWHLAARRHTKQTTFDDLYAVAEDLIARGVTTAEQLALTGFSNGGSTAGIALVQRPELWRVVAPGAPQFDWMEPVAPGPAADAMRSYATSEYGDPDDPDDAKVIFGISAYHNIRDGVAYPAVYSSFGALDPGCSAYHGRKFTARLRAATSSDRPIHLRVWPDCGHGAVGDVGAQWNAEWLAFVMDQLGMPVE
jgi:prolyl oligopeptidase